MEPEVLSKLFSYLQPSAFVQRKDIEPDAARQQLEMQRAIDESGQMRPYERVDPEEWFVVRQDYKTGQLHFYPAFVMHAEPWDPSKEPPPAASPPAP